MVLPAARAAGELPARVAATTEAGTDDGEMVQRATQTVPVLSRRNGKAGGMDLDALQECPRLAERVPGEPMVPLEASRVIRQ